MGILTHVIPLKILSALIIKISFKPNINIFCHWMHHFPPPDSDKTITPACSIILTNKKRPVWPKKHPLNSGCFSQTDKPEI